MLLVVTCSCVVARGVAKVIVYRPVSEEPRQSKEFDILVYKIKCYNYDKKCVTVTGLLQRGVFWNKNDKSTKGL